MPAQNAVIILRPLVSQTSILKPPHNHGACNSHGAPWCNSLLTMVAPSPCCSQHSASSGPPIFPYSSFISTLFFPPYMHESYSTGNYNIISGSMKNSKFQRIFDTSKNMFKNNFFQFIFNCSIFL